MAEPTTDRPVERIPADPARRAASRRPEAATTGGPGTRSAAGTDGPSPGRILAAAASVSAGVGLVALLAGSGGSTPVVVEVQPTPIVVENHITPSPAVSADPTMAPAARVERTVQAATPAPAPVQAAPAQPVVETEGS